MRLSHDNLRSNAEAIATSLRITADDRAATSLPLHYCYGLSVLNSHLVRGAGLVLTEDSVVDECFWDLFGRRGRNIVRRGALHLRPPRPLRLRPARPPDAADGHPGRRPARARTGPAVRRAGSPRGWDLVVMYGQTEATARMAYLPPELATRRPDAIGVPIPGARCGWSRSPSAPSRAPASSSTPART